MGERMTRRKLPLVLAGLAPSGNIALRKTGGMKYEDIAAQLSRMGVAP